MMLFLVKSLLVLSLFIGLPHSSAYAASEEFTILPGDVLQVSVWKEEGMDREIVVLPDGTITFPLAGSVHVSGLSPAKAQEALKSSLKSSIPDASVSIVVKAPLGHTVSVMGQVGKPGDIVIGQRMTVMQALSQAGGLTPFADTDDVKILRQVEGKETSIDFPYDSVANGNDLEKNIALLPGDVIVVPTSGLF